MATSATTSIVGLTTIIVMAIPCNVFAILFVFTSCSKQRTKDKIIALLCTFNLSQTIGYSIELKSAIERYISEEMCNVSAFIVCSSTYSSIGCFVMLMLERYSAIIYPFRYMAWMAMKPVKALFLLLPLMYGVSLGGAPLFGWGSYGRSRPNSTYCAFDFRRRTYNDKSFFFTVVISTFGLPLGVTILLSGHILCEVQRTAADFKRQYGRASTISRDSSRTVHNQCISSLLSALIYIASWLPYAVVCFFFYYEQEVSVMLEYTAIYMAKSSAITSPVCFCLIEKRVRKFIKKESQEGLGESLQLRVSNNAVLP